MCGEMLSNSAMKAIGSAVVFAGAGYFIDKKEEKSQLLASAGLVGLCDFLATWLVGNVSYIAGLVSMSSLAPAILTGALYSLLTSYVPMLHKYDSGSMLKKFATVGASAYAGNYAVEYWNGSKALSDKAPPAGYLLPSPPNVARPTGGAYSPLIRAPRVL